MIWSVAADGSEETAELPTTIATIQINAPAAEVYRYVATPHLLSEWVDGLKPKARAGGDSEIKVGMRAPDHGQRHEPGSGPDPGTHIV